MIFAQLRVVKKYLPTTDAYRRRLRWVIYTVGSFASSAVSESGQVASEQLLSLEYDFETLPVIFNINGRASFTQRSG